MKKSDKRQKPSPVPPQEDLYADYYPQEDPYDEGGAHLTPEDRERYYAERDAYYARRDAYYAQRDAYYAQREAEEEDETEPEEDWEEPAPRPRREKTGRRDYAPEEDPPERKPRRRRRRRGHGLRRTAALLLLLAVLALLWGTAPVRNPSGAARQPGHSTILLSGTDEGGGRTDTIMLLSLARGDRVRLLSLPRDTYVPNYTTHKLNAVYGAAGGGKEGMELLLQEASSILGFAPDGYVLVDMDTVIRAVDILGGADYTVPQDMDYEDADQGLSIHLAAGPQHLSGAQVIGLLRFRAGYANADIGRTEVQRDFLRQAAGQWLTLSNLGKVPELLALYRENTTATLTVRNLMWIARVLVKSNLREMVTEVLPGWADMVDGSSVYMIDRAAADEMLSAYNPYQ